MLSAIGEAIALLEEYLLCLRNEKNNWEGEGVSSEVIQLLQSIYDS